MSTSNRYKSLQKRLTELKKHLLPKTFNPLGIYSDCILDKARAYRLLAHAEIESYFEDISKEVIIMSISEWKKHKKPSSTLTAFLACFHSGWEGYCEGNTQRLIDLAKHRDKKRSSVDEIIDLAQSQYIRCIGNNHGVKEDNLKILINPTGLSLSELDPTWIADINDFGMKRGETAHNSKRTTGTINPQDEYIRVKRILIGIKEVDEKLQSII